jgi:hypothetical protein
MLRGNGWNSAVRTVFSVPKDAFPKKEAQDQDKEAPRKSEIKTQSGLPAKFAKLSALLLPLLGILCLTACKGREEDGMAKAPDTKRAIAALRDAYAAFNRGDMEAAVS